MIWIDFDYCWFKQFKGIIDNILGFVVSSGGKFYNGYLREVVFQDFKFCICWMEVFFV